MLRPEPVRALEWPHLRPQETQARDQTYAVQEFS